jgi:3-hydroxybutyryl-CoA dehydratase
MAISIQDIEVGTCASVEKQMVLEDVVSFAGISKDFNPVHLDAEYAAQTRFKKPIVHGLMASSLFSGIFGMQLPGEGCVYKSQSLKFKRPIYIGDVVVAQVEVIRVEPAQKVVFFRTTCSVGGRVVIDGEAEIFIP